MKSVEIAVEANKALDAAIDKARETRDETVAEADKDLGEAIEKAYETVS